MDTQQASTTWSTRHCTSCRRTRRHQVYSDGSTFCMNCGHRDARLPWRPAC